MPATLNTVATVVGVVAAVAAGTLTPALADESPARRDLVVTSERGARYEGNLVGIDVREGATPAVEIGIWAQAAGGAWSAGFGLSAEALLEGSGSVRLGPFPLAPQVGIVAVGASDAPAPVESGTLSFSVTAATRRMEGRATTSPADGSAVFEGGYVLRCWVRPESLGLPPNGEGEPGMALLVPDERGTSEFCRRFAGLR